MARQGGRASRFRAPAQVRLNASGYGYCTITVPNGVRWKVLTASIRTSTAVAEPTFTAYLGSSPSPSGFLEDTDRGSKDVSDTPVLMEGGESYTGEWTDGDAGAVATLILAGEQEQVHV